MPKIQKRKNLDGLISIVLGDLIDECISNGYLPNAEHLVNKIISRVDIVKTGMLGYNFVKAENTLRSITKKSVISCLEDSFLYRKIKINLIIRHQCNSDNLIFAREGLRCDDILFTGSKENNINFIEYSEINSISILKIKDAGINKIYFACDFTPQDEIEERKIKNLCDKYNIYFERFLLKQEHCLGELPIKMTLNEKIKYKEFSKTTLGNKYLLDTYSDRNFILNKISEISND